MKLLNIWISMKKRFWKQWKWEEAIKRYQWIIPSMLMQKVERLRFLT